MTMTNETVKHEIGILIKGIQRLGKKNDEDKYQVTFKELFDDDKLANELEALVGTLKAAKKRKVVSYKAQLLLQGMSDKEVITLLKDSF